MESNAILNAINLLYTHIQSDYKDCFIIEIARFYNTDIFRFTVICDDTEHIYFVKDNEVFTEKEFKKKLLQ